MHQVWPVPQHPSKPTRVNQFAPLPLLLKPLPTIFKLESYQSSTKLPSRWLYPSSWAIKTQEHQASRHRCGQIWYFFPSSGEYPPLAAHKQGQKFHLFLVIEWPQQVSATLYQDN